MWTWTFWRDATERAIATAAQTLVALLGVAAVDLPTVFWPALGAADGAAGLLSLLKSIAATQIGRKGTASLAAGPARPPYVYDRETGRMTQE